MRADNGCVEQDEEYPQETEALADSKGRVALSSVGAKPGRRYIVRRQADDVLTLIPARVIPEREMIVWENPGLAKTIMTGIEQAQRGESKDLGSFSQYADLPDDDEE